MSISGNSENAKVLNPIETICMGSVKSNTIYDTLTESAAPNIPPL